LLSAGTVYLGSEENSLKIKAYAKLRLQNRRGTLMNGAIVLLKNIVQLVTLSLNVSVNSFAVV
jgi:hypothetical protein